MMGTQRLSFCMAEAKHALETYLNEHVFADDHLCRVAELKWEERGSPASDAGPALVAWLDPADEVSAGREGVKGKPGADE